MADFTWTATSSLGPFIKSHIYSYPTITTVWYGNDGVIYEAGIPGPGTLRSDAGQPIAAWWRSKRLDFGDQYPDLIDKFKTVESVILEYIDVDANTPVTVHLSIDGGVNWVSNTRLLGTGNGKQKVARFGFLNKENITGKHFTVKIESVSASTMFTWTGLFLQIRDRGRWFEVS